jgi:hypothetical protein
MPAGSNDVSLIIRKADGKTITNTSTSAAVEQGIWVTNACWSKDYVELPGKTIVKLAPQRRGMFGDDDFVEVGDVIEATFPNTGFKWKTSIINGQVVVEYVYLSGMRGVIESCKLAPEPGWVRAPDAAGLILGSCSLPFGGTPTPTPGQGVE